MLRPPYTSYNRLYVYHLDLEQLPQFDEPDLIGIWIEDNSAVLFFHKPKERFVADLCRTNNCQVIYEADLDYKEWESGQIISTFSTGGITVAPIWEDNNADIRLDPSVIFGSGFHPTTRVCLETLLHFLKQADLKFDSIIDLGTGTGLLSIAAALYGAGYVTAVDNNPLACQVSKANCRLNNVSSKVRVQELDLRKDLPSTRGCNLLIANLYRGLLEQLFADPAFWQADFYILSGFIQSMEPDLLALLPTEKLRFLDRKRNGNWCIWTIGNREVTG